MTDPFLQLRKSHRRETAEDYVELVYELISQKKQARLIDIARKMQVSKVTAHKILSRLQKEGWIESAPYRNIGLTQKGLQMAKKSKKRHQIVFSFLKKLGISEKTARVDAEGIEHHVSQATLKTMQNFIRSHA